MGDQGVFTSATQRSVPLQVEILLEKKAYQTGFKSLFLHVFISWVILVELLNFSELLFLCLYNGNNSGSYLGGLL